MRGTPRFSIRFCGFHVLLSLLFLPTAARAQVEPPGIEWEKSFWGPVDRRGFGLDRAADGGYVILGDVGEWTFVTRHNPLGFTQSFKRVPVAALLIRTDADGNELWSRTFKDAPGRPILDSASTFHPGGVVNSVEETRDGGYVFLSEAGTPRETGKIFSRFLDRDVPVLERTTYLLRADAAGEELWREDTEVWASTVRETRDGGFIVSGSTRGFRSPRDSAYLLKTDARGRRAWSKHWSTRESSHGASVQQTSDDGYVLVGHTTWTWGNESRQGALLVKTDSMGREVWTRIYGESQWGDSVEQTADGGYVLGGGDRNRGALIIRTDAKGVEQWSRTFGEEGGGPTEVQVVDGGSVIAFPCSGAPGSYICLVQVDDDGNEVWSRSTGAGRESLIPHSFQPTADGGYIVAGQTSWWWDLYLVKLGLEPEKPPVPGRRLRRGDADASGGVNLTDAIYTLNHLFLAGPPPDCGDAADADDNGSVQITDPILTLNFLFLGGIPLPDPGPEDCGVDPTDDRLDCESYPACDGPGEPGEFVLLGDNEQGHPEYRHEATGIVFVLLPGGKFLMGAQEDNEAEPNHDPAAGDDQGPVHEVTLSPFLIAKHEVTQRQWLQVMGENPACFRPQGPCADALPPELLEGESWLDLPVEMVSWNDIQAFEERTGLTLPTEAQWEYAARGGTNTPFLFGEGEECQCCAFCAPCEEASDFMWWCGNSEDRTQVVGTMPPNPFGLHDMQGNVWEWCQDTYDPEFYTKPEALEPDPVSTSGGEPRVIRGGAWSDDAACRSAYRGWLGPSFRFSVGFRPVARLP